MRDYEKAAKDWDKESQERRAEHRNNAPRILTLYEVPFQLHTEAHLKVWSSSDTYDFWPGTGKYTSRSTGKSGRGIFNLIRRVRRENSS